MSAPTRARGSAPPAAQPSGGPMATRAMRARAVRLGRLRRSSVASGVDALLERVAQEVIAEHHRTRFHPRHRSHPLSDILPDADREDGWTQRRRQVEIDSDVMPLDLHVIEQTQLGNRATDFRVARRPSRLADRSHVDRHRATVPATPVSVAGFEAPYARLRWDHSSCSTAFSLVGMSMPYSRAMLPPRIFCLTSSVRSTPYSCFRSSGSWNAISSSSCQCGYQIGKSVP